MKRQFAILGLVVLGVARAPLAGAATTTNVTIGDNFFNPANVTINANDSVKWNWSPSNFSSHSSTANGTPALWDSGVRAPGSTFTQAFPTAGTFAYHCTVHAGQTGSVTVQGANAAPTSSLTAPTNGTTFAAPWTGLMRATVGDSDGTIRKVDFFAGATRLGTVSNPPANVSFTVTNLAAGNYSLSAVAMDNLGANTTSAPITLKVVSPGPITLGSLQRPSASSFQFTYSATVGLNYAIRRGADLSNLTPISTNTATSATMSFQDNNATAPVNFYSVMRLPNP